MARLNVSLFGKLSLQCNGQSVPGFDARKIQQLLCYLLLHRDHSFPREFLASLFWADHSTEQSKKHLRQALWQLQSALDQNGESSNSSRLLTVDASWVELHSGRELWLDVAEFEKAFRPVQDLQGRYLDLEKAQLLEQAAQLYDADLLEGWYDDWCLFERERFQNMYLAMLDKLMGYYEAHKQYETGILHGSRILFFDRAREHTHQHLMRLYYLAGNRTAALRQFERCSVALNEELGVKPAKFTLGLYEQIRADELDDSAPAQLIHTSDYSRSMSQGDQDLLGRLHQISELLRDVQKAAQRGMRTIEAVVKDPQTEIEESYARNEWSNTATQNKNHLRRSIDVQ